MYRPSEGTTYASPSIRYLDGAMKWNYLLGACFLLIVFSVAAKSSVLAVAGGIALMTVIKIGGVQLVERMRRKR
jgi:hypothetical protein